MMCGKKQKEHKLRIVSHNQKLLSTHMASAVMVRDCVALLRGFLRSLSLQEAGGRWPGSLLLTSPKYNGMFL